MARTFDTIVVGTGTMGAAACAALARRKRRVIGLDRWSPPHDRGSHHGATRLFRKAYFEHPDYVPLLHRAAELWRQVNVDAGTRIYVQTGGLFAGPPSGHVVSGTLASARLHGLAVEAWSAADVERRYPQFRVPAGYEALFDPDAAVLLAEPAVEAMRAQARRAGAELRDNCAVDVLVAEDGHVSVRTSRGTLEAGSVIVTGGAWASRLLPQLPVPLVVTRQVLCWVRERRAGSFAIGRCPVWGFENDDGSLSYGAPMVAGEPGAKVGCHAVGEPCDPDEVRREVTATDVDRILATVDAYTPGLTPDVVQTRVCLYTSSPDGHFIVDRLPDRPEIVVACGFSGHGFKFAPVIAEVLADLAIDGATRLPAAFLGLARFDKEPG